MALTTLVTGTNNSGGILAHMRVTTLVAVLIGTITATLEATDAYPPPRFTDPGRVAKLQSSMPAIDRIFRAYATERKIPWMIWGVVIDGQVAHLGSVGFRDLATRAPVTSDCRFEQVVAHGGGLPGFGSHMAWLPEYGVGMFAMASLTYSGPAGPISQAWDALLETGGLRERELPPTTLQTEMRDCILNLWKHRHDAEEKQIAAGNFFLDAPSAQRQAEISALKKEVGECKDAGPVIPENWMRTQFNMRCAKGTVGVFFTLAPTQPPAVQHLSFQKLASPGPRMGGPNRLKAANPSAKPLLSGSFAASTGVTLLLSMTSLPRTSSSATPSLASFSTHRLSEAEKPQRNSPVVLPSGG